MTHALRTVLISSIVLLSLPFVAQAESVLWSGTTGTLCSGEGNGCRAFRLSSVSHQVAYNVRVSNYNTGVVIASGSTVPSGTRVYYEFLPHVPADIYWFGTGGGNDSPNGDWVPGAASAGEICISKNYVGQVGKNRDSKSWANFTVSPPTKGIGGIPGNCTTASDGVSKICTLTDPATVSAQFVFAQTIGRYHGQFQRNQRVPVDNVCGSGLLMSHYPSETYSSADDISVPTQSIAHSITVETGPNQPPAAPTLGSGGACTVGEPHEVTMTATDADGDDIRYGIDWNADGSVDQFMPSSGYVPSGTSQTASRTYSTEGTKTVKVLAMDEAGASSGWATINFDCASTTTTNTNTNNNTNTNGSATNSVNPPAQCVPANYCVGNDLWRQDALCGPGSRVNRCVFGCAGNGCTAAPPGSGNIIALPSIVRSGETSQINWDTSGMASCEVVENDPDITDGADIVRGSFRSSALEQQTTFTLRCEREADGTIFTDSVRIDILPSFEED